MRDRFHSDPMVGSSELLLQERVPRAVELVAPHVEEVENVRSVRELPPPVTRSYATAETPVPATHFLSNGRYSVMVTNGGGGYSRCNDIAVNRYREDLTRDCWGTFFYVRDTDTGAVFSAPYNPRPAEPDDYHVVFAPDKAEFRRTDGDLDTHVEIAVSPEDDVEVRRLTITNHGRADRHLDVTSYFEVALAAQGADQAHKSFSNLFVETQWLPETGAVLFTRRPRRSDEPRLWGLHSLACEEAACDTSFETDRAAFLGRLRGADNPVALEKPGALGGSLGPVLDPCCSLRRSVTIPGGESVRLVYSTGIAERPRERAAPHREVLRRPQRPARHRPRVDGRAARAARPRHQPAGGGHARAAGFSAGAHRPVLAAQDQDARRERPADVGAVVDRHLGRPAHPAGARRGPRARAAGPPGAAGAPVLAAQGARGRPRRPQHAPHRLRRRPRRPAAAARPHRSRAAAARQARRRLPSPSRPDASRRAEPAALGRARDARRRRGHRSSCSSTAEASARSPPDRAGRSRAGARESYPPVRVRAPAAELRQRHRRLRRRRPATT